VVKQLFVVEMMVVKLVVGVVVAEGHGGERKKRETVVEKEKTREKADFFFYQLWPLISPPSGHEIHSYLQGVEEGRFILIGAKS
jgi:vacuolar-type H+-ATPase catalytic subunit A/Vma1